VGQEGVATGKRWHLKAILLLEPNQKLCQPNILPHAYTLYLCEDRDAWCDGHRHDMHTRWGHAARMLERHPSRRRHVHRGYTGVEVHRENAGAGLHLACGLENLLRSFRTSNSAVKALHCSYTKLTTQPLKTKNKIKRDTAVISRRYTRRNLRSRACCLCMHRLGDRWDALLLCEEWLLRALACLGHAVHVRGPTSQRACGPGLRE
jgi:hypothetical protein